LKLSSHELCAVVGRVASGKSTICSTILNETFIHSGTMRINSESIAYASQTPWILNATIRDNIIFGLPINEARYENVLNICQLLHDLTLLEKGDLTEIGERGINLSGGQKQRISIARAAYSNAEIIILDDPMSALDPEVARLLFKECIVDFMSGRTRLLATNQLQFLQSCDSVVALGNGVILEQGTYNDLNTRKGGEIQRLLKEISAASLSNEKKTSFETTNKLSVIKRNDTNDTYSTKKKDDNLLTKEERNVGAVSWSVYAKYLKAGGGYHVFSVVLLGFILAGASSLMSVAWITLWTNDANYKKQSLEFYLGVYAALAISLGIFTFLRTILLVRFSVKASYIIHRNILQSIFNAPQSFFDTTPIGRILSRFSKDMYSLDIELSEQLDLFLFCAISILSSIGVILFVTPWFAVGVLPLAFIYYRLMNYFRNVSRESKRLESISRSPVFAQFSETLGGFTTIRAYGQQARFIEEFEEKVNQNTRASYCNLVADRWLGCRLDFLGSIIILVAAVLVIHVTISSRNDKENNNFAPLAGLSLTFAISITGILSFFVRCFSRLEACMNSCERILFYTESIPQEAPSNSKALEVYVSSNMKKNASWPSLSSDPSAFAVSSCGTVDKRFSLSWPSRGEIVLQNLCMRYRSDTQLVLKGLNLVIGAGERIGIVGRTGSGKSSLLLALLRLVEPALSGQTKASYKAPILIDGVDTLRIGINELRSKIGIIPQNPILFSGTIRSNLDPFHLHNDTKIWLALEHCGLKKNVQAMPGMLDGVVSEYGENLSQGMRQLLVLGRALLLQCRILLLDEATSSVDYETDKEIQHTLRVAFKGCTVLTIAHRIDTIMDSDKILVMKDGLVEEFAPPQKLLANEDSSFAEILRQSNFEQSQ